MRIKRKIAFGGLASVLAATIAAAVLINPKPNLQKRTYLEKPAAQAVQPADEVFKYQMKVINPDGSTHYSVQKRNKQGKLLREYIEPSNARYELNPNAQTGPKFHSTIPVISNPDRTIDAYMPLKPGENLEDAIKKGPVDRFVPNTEKLTFNTSSFESGNYLTLIERKDICDNIYESNGNINGRFRVISANPIKSENPYQINSWKNTSKSGTYELYVTENNSLLKLGTIHLNKGDKIKFIRE